MDLAQLKSNHAYYLDHFEWKMQKQTFLQRQDFYSQHN